MHHAHLSGLLAATAIALAGCAASPQQAAADAETRRAAMDPLYCIGADQCALFWRRAQVWVAQNSRWSIKTANDTIIETEPPRGTIPYRFYRVLRVPGLPGQPDRITIQSGCPNLFGCEVGEFQAAAAFKAFVQAR